MEKNYFEKFIWDESDFENLGWHDIKIYAMAFDDERFELALDIDYIMDWVKPKEGEEYYKFYIAPATLIFKRVHELNINLSSLDVNIQDIQRNKINVQSESAEQLHEYDWSIETNDGEINFKATGFKQYLRNEPVLLGKQRINLKDRGGISFAIK